MIHFDDVSKTYPDDSTALEEVSFVIEPKEFVSIVGHSGAGKTTLLKMFLGEEKPTKGKIFYEGVDISTLNKKEMDLFRRKIGVVFQDFRLIPNKNVYENIGEKLEITNKAKLLREIGLNIEITVQ